MTRQPTYVTDKQLAQQEQAIDAFRSLAERPQSYCVVTYGCQMNAHDSELLAGILDRMGMREAADREQADLVLFNTCCVRENAERRALGNVTWLKEIKKERPSLIIGVCGCMVQQPGMAEKLLKQYPFIDLAFGTHNLYQLPRLLLTQQLQHKCVLYVTDEQTLIAEGLPAKRAFSYKAYLTIMYGCDNFCSYCVVPYVRGRERSRRQRDILTEAEQLLKGGVKEIMLLGQNVNSYGDGAGETFPGLLRELDRLGVPRIRFMTSHPKDLSDDLIDAMAQCHNVCHHLHLPVQSGNDDVLAAMNRRYTRARYLERVARLREAIPDIGLTTDLIVAFPGETEAQFLDTLSLVDEVGFDAAFTFIYSKREGTVAARMPGQIAPDVATGRIERLIAAVERSTERAHATLLGGTERVLVEGISKRDAGMVSGKGERAITITFDGTADDIGQIVPVRITSAAANTLRGERLKGD